MKFLGEASRIVGNLTYTNEVTDGERDFLFWTGIVDDREISGVTVLADQAGGPIGDITVLLAPGESSPTSVTRCSVPWPMSCR